MILSQIQVALGERSYPVYVGRGMTEELARALRDHKVLQQIAIITDRNVARHHLRPLQHHLSRAGFSVTSIVIPPGENQKTLARANTLYTTLLKKRFGRASTILAFGGGVIGDLAGFVAATFQRGVPLVQIPTTLLAQVDSSIGGKVAVNHPLGKNMIGAFYQPVFVWTDMDVLATLPRREVVCGLGEIVKYGVIRDAELFEFLEKNVERVLVLEADAVAFVQSRCSSIKAEITSKDEKETGIRAILNFGHTVGHALEAAGKYRLLKHGEAVLLGMIAESWLALKLAMIADDTYKRILELVKRIPLRARLHGLHPATILKAMAHDKKSVARKKRFMLPIRIGEVISVEDVSEHLIREAVNLVLKSYRSE